MAVHLNTSLRESSLRLRWREGVVRNREHFYEFGGTQSRMRGRSCAFAQKSDPGSVQPRSRDFARKPESP